ncbi:IclR family transcriptional regulator [Radiobacillus sp. PE A8.2]|uniref:IclR family transcriptional regulator n=1 Tax=Radiobacillus sp. PE A8.2 TaxID=3380349 RepID=UPI003890B5FF
MLKTLSLALEVMKMFTKNKPTWGGRELAAELDINHTKIYRILETLEMHQFLIKNKETKKYSLGFAVWELGNSISENFNIKEIIHPILEKVSERTNESVFLTVLDGENGLTFDAVEARTTVRFSVSIGSRTPLHAGASYRAILAHMPTEFIDNYLANKFIKYTDKTMVDPEVIREDLQMILQKGYAVSEGEYTEDVIAVAIPIFNKEKVIGSLTVSGPKYRIEEKQILLFISELSQADMDLKTAMEKYGSNFGLL